MCVDDDGKTPAAAIKQLKLGGAGGPDGFPPRVFKKLAVCIKDPLSLIFTSFMSVGQLPRDWKHAVVTPVYKSGAASSASNYRPISLTCVACKLMERVIVKQTLGFLRKHGVINAHQHGFLSGRSTTTNLLESVNDWTLAINDRKSVGAVYIDYKRAFDCVSHSKLLLKLRSYGISGQLFNWIANFLQNRTQQTRVGSSLSNITDLTSGVVQGSVIGPLLFVLFINDVACLFNDSSCVCKLYADDLKLYTVLESKVDCDKLQSKLNEICVWSDTWQLKISYKKCNFMYIGNTDCRVNMLLNDNVLQLVSDVKDLGVTVDAHLTFNKHIDQVVARAFIRSNLIHKCFVSRDVPTLLRAFLVYVRPVLEYASCVWSPYHVEQIKQIESVQKRFTKRLKGFETHDYKSRMSLLGIESLEIRRLKQDLIFTYKIVFGLVNNAASDLFTLTSSVNVNRTRGHAYKLFPHQNRIDVRKHFFSERVINTWNSLPAETKHFSSLPVFKRFLRDVDLRKINKTLIF